MNIWILIGIILLFILLSVILFSSIRIEIRYLRKANDDNAWITFYALGNLIRYQLNITQLTWEGFDEGVRVGSTSTQSERLDEKLMTKEKLQEMYHSTQLIIERIDHFYRIIRHFMSRVVCEKLRWETWIGTGNAAETGMIVGSVWGVKTTSVSVLGSMIQWDQYPNLQIHPCFHEAKLEIDYHSIIRFRIGYAILAFNRLVYHFIIKRRGKKWRNIQYKA